MARAAQLGSLPHRRKVKAGMIALVELAEHQRAASLPVSVRQRVVLEQRDSLLALAQRLGRPEPVEVAVAAQLSRLISAPSSPVYAGGNDPGELAELTSRWLDRVADGA